MSVRNVSAGEISRRLDRKIYLAEAVGKWIDALLGFRFFLVNCIDIDECSEDLHNCTTGEVCHNVDGSHRCEKALSGVTVPPLACPRGFQVSGNDVSNCIMKISLVLQSNFALPTIF